MSVWGRKRKPLPEDYDVVSATLTALENELRDKVNESHEGKRKVESQWPVHQLNWQRTYDLFTNTIEYQRVGQLSHQNDYWCSYAVLANRIRKAMFYSQ